MQSLCCSWIESCCFRLTIFYWGHSCYFSYWLTIMLAVPGLEVAVKSFLISSGSDHVVLCTEFSTDLAMCPVPFLFSPFVTDLKPLLIGVSLGGMGTLIASLANLISWKLYVKVYPKKAYFKYFTRLNVIIC